MFRAVVLAMIAAAAPARADEWLGADKALHFGATFALASGGYAAGAWLGESPETKWLAGAGLAVAAGVGKELYDLTGRGDASWKDLAWDGFGTAAGLLVALAAETLWNALAPPPASVAPVAVEMGDRGEILAAGPEDGVARVVDPHRVPGGARLVQPLQAPLDPAALVRARFAVRRHLLVSGVEPRLEGEDDLPELVR
jgi:uncharacterized protein YfiM (DUF2279 family)